MKKPELEELPEYDEMFQELLELQPVAKRLAGLTPEQRLAGLAPEHVILAMPLEVLRAFSEEYVRSLPVEVQAEIRRRLHEGS